MRENSSRRETTVGISVNTALGTSLCDKFHYSQHPESVFKHNASLGVSFLTIIFLFLLSATAATAISTTDTRMMHQPDLSATHIAFIYANDLWVARTDGSGVRRLTSDAGVESLPRFSA